MTELLLKYWPIFSVLAGWVSSLLVVSWRFSSRLKGMEMAIESHTKEIETVKSDVKAMNPVFEEIKSKLSAIEVTLRLLVDNKIK